MSINEPPSSPDQMGLPINSLAGANDANWKDKIPTVSVINRSIRGHLESTFYDVWVRGEISNFRKPISGHGYFVVKDAKSQLKGVMFRGQLSKVKFQVQDGMEVILHGSIGVYEARGEYQIICDSMEPVGVGALQLAFEQLKAKLQQEGLFDKSLKKPLPFLPKRIGMVTSQTGAAVRDVLKVLSRRFFNLETMIIPASVQGDKAAGEIVKAIELAETWNKQNPEKAIEALIVGRGGGSLEDLWPFNEEIVVRKIFSCPIPIISAVGHEIDFTISDFVADVRAPTPSAAAEIIVPRKGELVSQVAIQQKRMLAQMTGKIEQCKLHLGHLSQRLINPKEKIQKLKNDFILLQKRLEMAMQNALSSQRRHVEAQVQLLHSLSPLQVLSRGYSLTQTTNGKVIQKISEVKKDMIIHQRLVDGQFKSKVIEITPQK